MTAEKFNRLIDAVNYLLARDVAIAEGDLGGGIKQIDFDAAQFYIDYSGEAPLVRVQSAFSWPESSDVYSIPESST